MISTLMKLVGASGHIRDILNGDAEADDVEAVMDLGGDILTSFVPAAAPVIEIAKKFAEPLARVMNQQEAGTGDKFLDDLASLEEVTERLTARASAVSGAINDMLDDEFTDFTNKAGY